jgi:predicted dehydrogenase
VRKLRVFEHHAYHGLDYGEQQVERYAMEEAAGGRALAHSLLPVTRDEPLRSEIESFLACVRERKEPAVTGVDGRRALALAIQIAGAAAEASAR